MIQLPGFGCVSLIKHGLFSGDPYVLMGWFGGNPLLFGQAATGTDPQQGAALARAMLEATSHWMPWWWNRRINSYMEQINPNFFFEKNPQFLQKISSISSKSPNFFKISQFLQNLLNFLIKEIHFASQNCRETPLLFAVDASWSCLGATRDKATTSVTRNIPSPMEVLCWWMR